MVVLHRGDAELARWPLGDWGDPDLGVADGLARLQLAARWFGWSIRLEGAPVELVDLLELVGLREVIPVNVLRIEPWRQAEVGEQLDVEEVVVADDPVA
jgi:hypothetical protein